MTEIFDSKNMPILARQEPYFRKYFAEGGLVRIRGDTFRLAFWNESENIQIDEEDENEKKTAKGFVLECEIIMSRTTAIKIRDLIDYKLKEKGEDLSSVE